MWIDIKYAFDESLLVCINQQLSYANSSTFTQFVYATTLFNVFRFDCEWNSLSCFAWIKSVCVCIRGESLVLNIDTRFLNENECRMHIHITVQK